MKTFEVNMDGLVGQTHNYSGLAQGNLASTTNALQMSNPQAAALQGLAKMRLLHSMGLKQGIIPPHQRPNLHLLHQLGFHGTPIEQLTQAYKSAPKLFSACYSASSMWTANMATVSASVDTQNKRVHFTPANLVSHLHRHQECCFSKRLLSRIFSHPDYFHHHDPLPQSTMTSDEGAANHSRLCSSHTDRGINFFVYGKEASDVMDHPLQAKKYPARQTKEASQAIARSHGLNPQQVLYARQNPKAIDLGVFHNDVICVANESVLLIHEEALVDQQQIMQHLKKQAPFPLKIIEITNSQLQIQEAVKTYLFNSQLVTLPEQQGMILIAPIECKDSEPVKTCIDQLLADSANPIQAVLYLDLKQSMRNGGGPACLRLRVPLNERELAVMHQGVLVTDKLIDTLEQWVIKYYRTQLRPNDLLDPQLMDETFHALDELTQILHLGSIYPFQLET